MTRPLADRFPRLFRLFAGYANQDFDALGLDPLDAVRAYARDASASERDEAIAEIGRLRAERPSERALASALARLRLGADVAAFGHTHATFLDAVERVLRR